ncbi:MAG: hypothetical protein ACK4HF_08220 [Paracoccaceae bacterium]
MGIFSKLSRHLTLGATSVVTFVALSGCMPIEGEKPKVCDHTKAQQYKGAYAERCKMVQPKATVKKAVPVRKANY